MNTPRTNIRSGRAALAALFGVITLAAQAPAQSAPPATPTRPGLAHEHEGVTLSRSHALCRLDTLVHIRFADHPLHDVIRYLSLVADVPLDPLWIDAHADSLDSIGLDPMAPITLDTHGLTVLQALEATLDLAGEAQRLEYGATWQFSPTGTIELGPRERLNRASACRTEVYDVQDLLSVFREPPEAPRLAASTAGQLISSGSGPDQWVFSSDNTHEPPPARVSRASRLRELIIEMVETQQWTANGGPASIQIYEGAFVVHAPDYIHRALVGPLGENIRSNYE